MVSSVFLTNQVDIQVSQNVVLLHGTILEHTQMTRTFYVIGSQERVEQDCPSCAESKFSKESILGRGRTGGISTIYGS